MNVQPVEPASSKAMASFFMGAIPPEGGGRAGISGPEGECQLYKK